MSQLYVILETEIRDRFEPCYQHVLGITASQDLAVALIQKRHPSLEREESAVEAEEGELKFALRGKGRALDGDDLYFCFEIKPFQLDPKDLGTIIYELAEEDEDPDEFNEGD
jgi:hypothetical protein